MSSYAIKSSFSRDHIMNYKHAYHAGNFADVVKHVLLIQLLNQLSQKGKPYYVLDAYGGRGLYKLNSDEAKATNEAKLGIQILTDKLYESDKLMPKAVAQYLKDLEVAKNTYDKHVYPGSPWWIAHEVERQSKSDDCFTIRAEAFESQADEYDALNYQIFKLPIGVHHRNAFEGIPAVIPPKERRGLVLIDPPFEQEHKDFTNLVELLVSSYKKWPQGTYALWYPLKNIEAVSLFHKKMKRTGIKKQLVCELNVYPNDVPVGMNGTGMLIINPPWKFDNYAQDILKYLQPILRSKDIPNMSQDESWRVNWLVGEN